jgi:REP element-mobilizing transposase RayT
MSFPRQVVPGRVYLVTRRCTQRQFLLRPDDETNNAFLYCYAYAAMKAGIETIAFLANSNHYHAVIVDRLGQVPVFIEAFHKLLAKHQNCLRRRVENLWATEQCSLVELVDENDILDKVIYTLCNPVKDHLVARAHEWPGASSRRANLHGKSIRAHRPSRFFRADGEMPPELTIECKPIPGFQHLSEDAHREMLTKAIEATESAAAEERRRTGRTVLGREAILAQCPTDCPSSIEPRREIVPQIAARDKCARRAAIERSKVFRDIYAEMRDGWLAGMNVLFPAGTWWLRRFAKVRCVPCPESG